MAKKSKKQNIFAFMRMCINRGAKCLNPGLCTCAAGGILVFGPCANPSMVTVLTYNLWYFLRDPCFNQMIAIPTVTTLESVTPTSASQPNPPATSLPNLFPHAVEYAQHHSIRTTACHFGLDRQQVRAWLGRRENYESESVLQEKLLVSKAKWRLSCTTSYWTNVPLGVCVTGVMIRVNFDILFELMSFLMI
jgi:hypothetical protein